VLKTFLRRAFSGGGPELLRPGDPAPAFEAVAHTGETVRLADLAGRRVVLWFYPAADTPG